ncbi:VPLPA-CTERM sorting domain-containing protein [uncultured Celeribacter sp.]|uniref:VPLPA-CTERM sorting domain-containing protein n=1 Tax=uncultured Celeribacter sp. TaxID=1303376 RepID=UPI002AA92D56|nr:VPLPA-CTERM sorting domain-containing protein [uncultured Celeribacter sp.]
MFDGFMTAGGSKYDVWDFSITNLSAFEDLLDDDLITLRFETDSFASVRLMDLDNEGGAYAASLTVDYDLPAVPLPAGLPLMLGGFGLFGMLRRRKS